MDHIAGNAHDAQEGVHQGIVDPPDAVFCLQHRPDLALGRQDHPVQHGGDNRNLHAFMGVREGCHIRHRHQGRLQPVSAGGAVLNGNSRDCLPQAAEEPQGSLHILPQALTQAVRIIAAHADAVVIVHLDVIKAAALQQADDPLFQVGVDLFLPHIQEAPVVRVDHRAEAGQQQVFPVKHFRLGRAGFRFKPEPRFHAPGSDHVRRGLQAFREHFLFFRDPVPAAV